MKKPVVDEDGPTKQQFARWYWTLTAALVVAQEAILLPTPVSRWGKWTLVVAASFALCMYVDKWSRYFAWRQWAKRWNKQPGHTQSYVWIGKPMDWWRP